MARQAEKDFDKNGKQRGWKIKFRYKDAHGNTKYTTKSGFKKKADAEEWLNNFMTVKNKNLAMKFESFVDIYFEDMKRRLKESTIYVKKRTVKSKIIPYFGNSSVNEITPIDIRNWQNELLNKGYSPTYLRGINSQIACILTYAVKYYDLNSNPCIKAGMIGSLKGEEMKIWTLEEFKQFINAIKKEKTFSVAFTVLYMTGMRVGELLALSPEDIDLNNNEIRINKSYKRMMKKDLITEPKTPKSKRIVQIPVSLTNQLKEYMDTLYGLTKQSRLFNVSEAVLRNTLKKYSQISGVKEIRVHDLRHSHASLLIEMGFSPVVIAERLGHEKVSTTLDTYSHLFPNKQKELAKSLEKLNQEWNIVTRQK